MDTDERRELVARYMFEQTPEWRQLASAEDDSFDGYVERNQDEWRGAASELLAFVDGLSQ